MKSMSSSTFTSPIDSMCVAKAVSIFGDKWTPLLIRSLTDKTLRFCQIQDEVGNINPRTLSARLSHLEEEGIISKVLFNEIPPHSEYTLTQKGKDLLPILKSMAVWGEKYSK